MPKSSRLSAERRQLITAYARWALLRRAKRDRATGDITPGGATHVRVSVRGIIIFLDWLTERHTALGSITQAQLEEFMTVRSSSRWLPQFLIWVEQNENMPDIEVPSKAKPAPSLTGFEEQHEETIRRLSTDDSIDLDARLAGLLIAVYGQLATRTFRLRRGQLRATGNDGAELALGQHPLTLATPVAKIARKHLESLAPAEPNAWLFPGLTPGGHRDPQYLNRRLKPFGTSISALQKAARFRLAGTVPSKILADALGFNVPTFEQYANLAASTRGDYPLLREV
ncbi:MAG: hypothetical protein ACTJFR_10175 [Canibacter sp.]